jgi:hypothetical protein
LSRTVKARIICNVNRRAEKGMQSKDLGEKLKRLSAEQQHEVVDFLDSLLSRTPDAPDTARVLRETAGLWEGEIDGITYENALREQRKQRC